MAETPVAPNNKPVNYGAKAASEPAGAKNTAPMKKSKGLQRKRAKSAIKRGMISEKAAKRHLGEDY